MLSLLIFLCRCESKTVCLYEKDASLCGDIIDRFGPSEIKNFNLTNEFLTNEEVHIEVIGRISVPIDIFPGVSDNKDLLIVGNTKTINSNSIYLQYIEPLDTKIEAYDVELVLPPNCTKIEIKTISLDNVKINCNSNLTGSFCNFLCELSSALYFTRVEVNASCSLMPKELKLNGRKSCNFSIQEDASFLICEIDVSMIFGLYANSFIIWKDDPKDSAQIIFDSPFNVVINHDKGELGIVNLLSYAISNKTDYILIDNKAKLHFLPCMWNPGKQNIVVNSYGSEIIFECSKIPVSVYHMKNEQTTFVISQESTEIVGDIGTPDDKANFFIVGEGKLIVRSLKIYGPTFFNVQKGVVFKQKYLFINTNKDVMFEGTGQYSVEAIEFIKCCSISYDNFILLSKELAVHAPVAEQCSNMSVKSLVGSGTLILHPLTNDVVFENRTTLFSLTVSKQTKKLECVTNWGYNLVVFPANTNFFSTTTTDKPISYNLVALLLKENLYSSWCVGRDNDTSLCDTSTSFFLNSTERANWPTPETLLLKRFSFNVVGPMGEESDLDFQPFLSSSQIDLNINGVDGKRFVFDGTFFSVFKKINATNAVLEVENGYIAKSNVEIFYLTNSTIDPILVKPLRKARTVFLDLNSAKSIPTDTKFSGIVNIICERGVIFVENKGIHVTGQKNILATRLILNDPSMIIGYMKDNEDAPQTFITILSNKSVSIAGSFHPSFKFTVSSRSITITTEQANVNITVKRNTVSRFNSISKTVRIPKLVLNDKLIVDMPNTSTLIISNVIASEQASIVNLNNAKIIIKDLIGDGNYFVPSETGYNELVETKTPGTNIEFKKDNNENFSLRLVYLLSRMSTINFGNGSYNSMKKIILEQTNSFAEIEEKAVMLNPYPFVEKGVPLIETEGKCDAWKYEFVSEKSEIFRKHFYCKCYNRSKNSSVFLYGSKDLLPQPPYDAKMLYIVIFSIAVVILLVGVIALIISFYCHKKNDVRSSYSKSAHDSLKSTLI